MKKDLSLMVSGLTKSLQEVLYARMDLSKTDPAIWFILELQDICKMLLKSSTLMERCSKMPINTTMGD